MKEFYKSGKEQIRKSDKAVSKINDDYTELKRRLKKIESKYKRSKGHAKNLEQEIYFLKSKKRHHKHSSSDSSKSSSESLKPRKKPYKIIKHGDDSFEVPDGEGEEEFSYDSENSSGAETLGSEDSELEDLDPDYKKKLADAEDEEDEDYVPDRKDAEVESVDVTHEAPVSEKVPEAPPVEEIVLIDEEENALKENSENK